jgi:hypothetical protein
MGTLHPGMGGLHGITVVVDTTGPRIVIGRCWEANERGVLLVGADVYEEGQGGRSKEEWALHAARTGVWGRHARIQVPAQEVASIRRLGEIAADAGHGGGGK